MLNMRKIPFLILLIGLVGCSGLKNSSLFKNDSAEPPVETASEPVAEEEVTLEPAVSDLLDEALEYYNCALDSVKAGNKIEAQKLFEDAIIILSEIEPDSLDISEKDLHSLRLSVAKDYADLLGEMQELPAESSPSAVLLGLSEFLGDTITSTEDLLGLMIPMAEEPRVVDTTAYRQLYPDVPLIINSKVERAVKYYTTKGRKVFTKWLERSEEAIPYYTQVLQEEGMPPELVYLAMIESGFSPRAYSRAHASGPWQFISSTARIYGLKVGYWYDERRDPEKSTRAACNYLKKLYDEFGDWYLAFAAYNSGERRVHRAMRKSGKSDYWGARRYLPRQTREYVPSMLAARAIAQHPEKYGFKPLDYKDPERTKIVIVEGCVSVKEVARAAGVAVSEIKRLNPAIRRDCTPPSVERYELRIPEGAGKDFDEKIAQAPRLERSEWVRHRVRRGETLSTIAAKYGISMRAIMSIPSNNLKNPHKIRAGKYLMIPVGDGNGRAYVESRVGSPQPIQVTTTDGKHRSIYRVRNGDSLSEIAQKFRVRVSDLKSWNNLWAQRFIYPGQKLIVWTKEQKSDASQTQMATIGPPDPNSGAASGNQVYVVQSGDTLWDISQLYGVSIKNLMSWNNIRSARIIKPGMVLKLQP